MYCFLCKTGLFFFPFWDTLLPVVNVCKPSARIFERSAGVCFGLGLIQKGKCDLWLICSCLRNHMILLCPGILLCNICQRKSNINLEKNVLFTGKFLSNAVYRLLEVSDDRLAPPQNSVSCSVLSYQSKSTEFNANFELSHLRVPAFW